jgi:hypothetical protein
MRHRLPVEAIVEQVVFNRAPLERADIAVAAALLPNVTLRSTVGAP